MNNRHFSALGPTSLFVLLWSSGTIVSEIGLHHGSPFALLTLRYVTALAVLVPFALSNGKLLPARGTRLRVATIGLAISGLYSTCYLLALDHGVTPGALATMLGVQPILTLFVTERKVTPLRMAGLLLALGGLALIVSDGLLSMRLQMLGVVFALVSLLGITYGSILQKRETQAPWEVLPLQYLVGLATIAMIAPFGDFRVSTDIGFIGPVLWLGLVISVGATFLLYRLIARGNLVNVTSLFYLVPAVTAAMDWVFLGNPMSHLALAGLALTIIGLALVFRQRAAS
jgi:drug/metabolite transporter (DMT)-like permease